MVDFSSMAGGFRKSMEDDRATRKDIANTFAQFRKDNPYATLDDMQDQINILSGGRNYLKAGLPSTGVLQGIATSNEENKAQADLQKEIKNYGEINEIEEVIRKNAEKYLVSALFDVNILGQTDDNVFNKLNEFKDNYIKTLPENIATKLDTNMEQLIGSVFTRDNATKIRTKSIDEKMPKAKEIILDLFKKKRGEGNNNYDLTQAEANRLMRETGIPGNVLSDLTESMTAEFKLNLTKESNQFVAQIEPIFTTNIQQYESEWQNGNKDKDDIKALIKTNLKLQAKNQGVTIEDTQIDFLTDGILSKVTAAWDDGKRQRLNEEDNFISRKREAILKSVNDSLQSGKGAAFAAFERGGIDELKAYVQSIINSELDAKTVDGLFGTGSKDAVSGRLMNELTKQLDSAGVAVLDAQEKAFKNERQTQAGIALKTIKEEKALSEKLGTKYFGQKQGNYAFTQMADGQLAGGAAEIALNRLSSKYYITDGMVDFFMTALSQYTPIDPSKKVLPGEIEDYFISVGGKNLQTWADRTKDMTSAFEGGTPERIMTFTSWKNQFEQDAGNAMEEINKNIDELSSVVTGGNVDELTLPKLNMVLSQINSVMNEVQTGTNQAGQTQTLWVQDGQKDQWNWDQSDIMKFGLLDKLEAMKEQVSELKDNQAVTGFTKTNAKKEMEYDKDVQTILSKGGSAQDKKGAMQEVFQDRALQLIQAMQSERKTSLTTPTYDKTYGYGAFNEDLWGSLEWLRDILGVATRQEKYKDPWDGYKSLGDLEIVDDFLANPKSMWLLTQNTTRMQEFIKDPIEYINSTKQAGSTRTIDIFNQAFK